ncbi:hypothetical protein FRC17_004574 [Serendipita sp. 399]|nr:hypothetical protein FRC17_004574 [Serendipita sp. 399]
MSQTHSRGGPSFPSRGARSRGGRNRGKSQRARGLTRGLRIPPEFLAQVVAQREGRDPSSVENPEEELDEEEINAFYARFAARPLESNEGKYEEVAEENGEASNEDEDTREVLSKHRAKIALSAEDVSPEQISSNKRQKNGGDVNDNDVDHALGASLRALSMKTGRREDDAKEHSKVVRVQWSEELEEISREKADAEARNGKSTAWLKYRMRWLTSSFKPSKKD